MKREIEHQRGGVRVYVCVCIMAFVEATGSNLSPSAFGILIKATEPFSVN